MLYFDGGDRESSPESWRGGIWRDLPLETWFLEVRGDVGSRNMMSPFDMYEALMGRTAEIREERDGDIFSIGRRDKRQGFGKSAPMIIATVEGLQDETRWLHPTCAATHTCFYPNGVSEKDVRREPTAWINPTSEKVADVWNYRAEFGSLGRNFSMVGEYRSGEIR